MDITVPSVDKLQSTTLHEVLQGYLQARKSLKPKTLYDYERVFSIAFTDWQNKPITTITKDQVTMHHQILGEKHGGPYANLAMRLLRALFNFLINQYKGVSIVENPVKLLSQANKWYPIKQRQTFIKPNELANWYQCVIALQNETARDYLLFTLLTGLCRQQVAQLSWEQVDLAAKVFSIKNTQDSQACPLPLSDYLCQILLKRQQQSKSAYVFPSNSKAGYIVQLRKEIASIVDTSGIQFTLHDLRRTFIMVAKSLNISEPVFKQLLNYKTNIDVMTQTPLDVEQLRIPLQLITNRLLEYFGKESRWIE